MFRRYLITDTTNYKFAERDPRSWQYRSDRSANASSILHNTFPIATAFSSMLFPLDKTRFQRIIAETTKNRWNSRINNVHPFPLRKKQLVNQLKEAIFWVEKQTERKGFKKLQNIFSSF